MAAPDLAMAGASSDSELSDEATTIPKAKGVRRNFSEASRACLRAYYQQGMTGTGKKYFSLIHSASRDTQLSTDQVKVQMESVLQYRLCLCWGVYR